MFLDSRYLAPAPRDSGPLEQEEEQQAADHLEEGGGLSFSTQGEGGIGSARRRSRGEGSDGDGTLSSTGSLNSRDPPNLVS